MKNKALLVALAAVICASQAQAAIVYDNLTAPSVAGGAISSTDLNRIWGDSVTLTQGGLLDSFSMTFFNSATGNTASVLSATINVNFYNNTVPYVSGDLQTALPSYGGFNGTSTWATGLAPGFYSVITFTGLSALNINVGQNLFITQQVTASTGGSLRLGTVLFTADTVGTGSSNAYYSQTGATEGYFTSTGTSNNLGYRVDVVPEPASMVALAAGAALIARQRKKA